MANEREASAYLEAKRAARDALRQRLLRVAAERLEADGLDALSMRPLARAAGCSTMVFYTEFGSKDALLEALADAHATDLLEAVETVADIDTASHRQAVVQAFLDSVSGAPEAYRVVMRHDTSSASGAPGTAAARRSHLDARLATALVPDADGVGPDAMHGVVLALHGAAQRLVSGESDRESVERTLEALLAALSSAPSRPT